MAEQEREQQLGQYDEANEANEALEQAVKRLYIWLVSRPDVLFQEVDRQRMAAPIIHLKQTGDWLSQSAIAKTEWFFEQGHTLLMRRLQQKDYDCYE